MAGSPQRCDQSAHPKLKDRESRRGKALALACDHRRPARRTNISSARQQVAGALRGSIDSTTTGEKNMSKSKLFLLMTVSAVSYLAINYSTHAQTSHASPDGNPAHQYSGSVTHTVPDTVKPDAPPASTFRQTQMKAPGYGCESFYDLAKLISMYRDAQAVDAFLNAKSKTCRFLATDTPVEVVTETTLDGVRVAVVRPAGDYRLLNTFGSWVN